VCVVVVVYISTRLRCQTAFVLSHISTYDLAIALQYGQGIGSAQLLEFINEHVQASLFNLLISYYILTDN
jgi:hypothetical protein